MATRTASQYIRLKIEQVTGSQYEMTFCYFFYIVKMKVDRIMSQSFSFFFYLMVWVLIRGFQLLSIS